MIHNNHDLIGTSLGNCRIEQLIGRGGHAAVFLATQESLHRPVAVKVLRPQVDMSSRLYENFLARFQREAGVIAQFTHINIMQIHDYGEQNGLAYLVMPYYAGGSLQDLLNRQSPLSLHQTLTCLEQAASALDYAHRQGVIHRDIKPANFLLASDGRLVLADFGIAHMMIESMGGTTLTETGLVLGTPEYMAPEMIQGRPVDLRADIYELGILLFQMLSGNLPFRGGSPYATMLMHLTDPMPLLHHSQPAIPPAVDNVIQQATMKDPHQRFKSAGELAQALRSAANGRYPHMNTTTVSSPPPQRDINSHYTPTILPHKVPSHAQPTVANLTVQAQLPPVPPHLLTPRKRHVLPFILIPFLILMIIGTSITVARAINGPSVTAAQTPTVAASPTLTPEQAQAQKTVRQFYTDLNSRGYYAAYNMGTPTPAGYLSEDYCRFTSVYQSTDHDDITFDGAPYFDQDHYVVPITIRAHEAIHSTIRDSIYQEYPYVAQENSTWKLLPGRGGGHHLGTATPLTFSGQTLTDQAQTLVRQYYAYISQRNYPTAYNLWGSDASASQYCKFVDGYARTKNVDIASINGTEQADGTVNVDVTINATEVQDAGGTALKTYHLNYTVEQANNTLDIKSSSLL